ncbi:MAG: hypothetical protein Fur0039_21920 [Rhodocyclaceae bacterium]
MTDPARVHDSGPCRIDPLPVPRFDRSPDGADDLDRVLCARRLRARLGYVPNGMQPRCADAPHLAFPDW